MCATRLLLYYVISSTKQGWVFAMAKSIFAGTVEKTGKNWQKSWQKPIFCGSDRLHYFNI